MNYLSARFVALTQGYPCKPACRGLGLAYEANANQHAVSYLAFEQ